MKNPATLSLLLVDDNETFLATLRAYVEDFAGVRVVALARSGEQAVVLAELHAPDLVIMDISMPGIGGIEATRLLKHTPRAPLVAIVTLHRAESYRRAALEAGADHVIAKDNLHEEFPGMLARIAGA